jgi:2-methylisocitrate lyase-like PEP mutase family enzyme
VSNLADAAETLRALHVPGRPLLLPNAWDVASAKLVVVAGFPVVATSSAALNAALGHRDDGSAPADEVFAAIARIARAVDVPVTADVEDGYGLAPEELAGALLDAGAVGCNLEDTDHARGGLVPAQEQAERIAAVKDAARARGVDLVVNARVDAYLLGLDPAEALQRAPLYLEAGADCIYPITIPEAELAAFVAAVNGPVNALTSVADLGLQRLAALGVARVSLGSRLAQSVTSFLSDTLARLREEQ